MALLGHRGQDWLWGAPRPIENGPVDDAGRSPPALQSGTVVVAGASLAGLGAAEALRSGGFEGRLVLVGEEDLLPYDRPPLSKQVLAGVWGPERTSLRTEKDYDALGAEWWLGRSAVSLDLDSRRVVLDDGEPLAFDGLIIATGASPRRLASGAGADLEGVHVLRTLADCLAIRAALTARPSVAVVGGGFIGAEVASSCRSLGLDVSLLEAASAPLARVLGEDMGAACASLHLDHGVDLRCGAEVAGLEGSGRVERVLLRDGATIEADLVVVGVGVRPCTGWLESSGLALSDGVVCDDSCATAAPGVVAAGDVARWHNRLFDEAMRVEHWSNALAQGAAAARALLAAPNERVPYAPVTDFWSDQYDVKIQFAGRCALGDEVRVAHGSLRERRFVALYARAGRLVGALSFNWPRLLFAYSRQIGRRATVEAAIDEVSGRGAPAPPGPG